MRCGHKYKDLVARKAKDHFRYRGVCYQVYIEYSVCSVCGEEIITTEQIMNNEKAIKVAKALIDSTMRGTYELRSPTMD